MFHSEHCIVFMCDDIKVSMATEEVREGGIRRSEGQLATLKQGHTMVLF